MTAPAGTVERPALRFNRFTIVLLALAALTWVGVTVYARGMGNGRGTMALSLRQFTAMWAAMMAAMMLPAVAPVATLYARTIKSHRTRRLTVFLLGYLVAWAAVGIPAFYLLRGVDHFAAGNDTVMRSIAVVTLLTAGIYQLSPLKAHCLRHCRSPVAQLLHYGNVKGSARDFKVALHHAAYCLGCCWALMALFIAFGVMNVWAMIGLATVVLGEKILRHGDALGRVVGAVCLVAAALVVVSPSVADTLIPASRSHSRGTMTKMSGQHDANVILKSAIRP